MSRTAQALAISVVLLGSAAAGARTGSGLFAAKRATPRWARAGVGQKGWRNVTETSSTSHGQVQRRITIISKPGITATNVDRPFFEVYTDPKTKKQVARVISKVRLDTYFAEKPVVYRDHQGLHRISSPGDVPSGARGVKRIDDHFIQHQALVETRFEVSGREAGWLARLARSTKRGKRGLPAAVQQELGRQLEAVVVGLGSQGARQKEARFKLLGQGLALDDLVRSYGTATEQAALKTWAKASPEVRSILKKAKKEQGVGKKRAAKIAWSSLPLVAGLSVGLPAAVLGVKYGAGPWLSSTSPHAPLMVLLASGASGYGGTQLARAVALVSGGACFKRAERASEQLLAAQSTVRSETVRRARASGLEVPAELAHLASE